MIDLYELSPLDCPFVEVTIPARLSAPVSFKDTTTRGTAGTLFHGALPAFVHARLATTHAELCHWLVDPVSRSRDTRPDGQGLKLAVRPLWVRTAALDGRTFTDELPLTFVLTGRQALHALPRLFGEPLEITLTPHGDEVRLFLEPPKSLPEPHTFRQAADGLAASGSFARRVLLEFATTCVFASHAAGGRLTPDTFDPDRILGDFIRQLVLFDVADRGVGIKYCNQELKAACDARAAVAAKAIAAVCSDELYLRWVEHGLRTSSDVRHRPGEREASGEDRYAIAGVRGYWGWEGDLTDTLPWLMAMAVCGLGSRRSLGCGQVRLWTPW